MMHGVLVGERLARRDATLGDRCRAVVVVGTVLVLKHDVDEYGMVMLVGQKQFTMPCQWIVLDVKWCVRDIKVGGRKMILTS